MELGLVFPQTEIGDDVADIEAYGREAEHHGFRFLVASDHVVGADPPAGGAVGPYALEDAFHEPFVLFGLLAGVCRLDLVPGVIVLPQRQAVLVAKQAAEVDVLTRGRLRLGVGLGWNAPQFAALGVDFADRAARYEEQIAVMRRLWTEPAVTFHGRYHRLEAMGLRPLPVQRPIPVWMGGTARRPVLGRIGRLGDGWITNDAPGPTLEAGLATLREATVAAGRPVDAVGVQGKVEVGTDLSSDRLRALVATWQGLGATHLSFSGRHVGRTPRQHVAFVRQMGVALLG